MSNHDSKPLDEPANRIDLQSDYDRYTHLQAQFQAIWQEMEEIKNRHNGHVPKNPLT